MAYFRDIQTNLCSIVIALRVLADIDKLSDSPAACLITIRVNLTAQQMYMPGDAEAMEQALKCKKYLMVAWRFIECIFRISHGTGLVDE